MVLRRAVDQPNRWAFRCRANVNGERVAVPDDWTCDREYNTFAVKTKFTLP